MTIRNLLFIPLMMLVACNSETANSAAGSASQLSHTEDKVSDNQRSETNSKYRESASNDIASNGIEGKTKHKTTYYKGKANVVHIPGSKQVKINIDDVLIVIKLVSNDGSYLDFKKGNDYLNKFAEIGFNYTYDTDLEEAIKRIKVFKSTDSEQGILILPEGTEEYPTYTISPFDNTGIKHSYTAEIQSFDCDNFDTIVLSPNTISSDPNVHELISVSQKSKACELNILESKSIQNTVVNSDIETDKQERSDSPRKKLQVFSSKELAQTYSSNLYQFYNFDVNADGIKDKIITHKQDKNKGYQGNDLFVYLADLKNNYKLSLKTNSFTDEVAFFLKNITPRSDYSGFILTTYFADRGHFEQSFYFGLQDDKWLMTKYVSAGTLITGIPYYCIENHSSDISDFNYGESSEYHEAEFEKYCLALASHYKVTANKAEILNQNFNPQTPANYYTKGDIIEALYQNEDWIKVAYKNDTKRGWVDKRNLKAVK